jgi:hypothetical protein
LQVRSITGATTPLEAEIYSTYDNLGGTLTHSRGKLSGSAPTGTFTLCSVALQASGVTSGTSLAFTELTDAYFEGRGVLDTAIDGAIAITGHQVLLPAVLRRHPTAETLR